MLSKSRQLELAAKEGSRRNNYMNQYSKERFQYVFDVVETPTVIVRTKYRLLDHETVEKEQGDE